MADEGLRIPSSRIAGLVAMATALGACVTRSTAPASSATAASAPAAPAMFPDDARSLSALPAFHSARLGVTLPLPDGRAWRIDDHSRPELVATHAATRSRVLVAVVRSDALVGRQQCEAIAHERKIVPDVAMRTIEDAVELRQEAFDTRVRVGLVPGARPGDPAVGHVTAFEGFLRKCVIFDFATEAQGPGGEEALSQRLAVARTRILGGLRVDAFGVPERTGP